MSHAYRERQRQRAAGEAQCPHQRHEPLPCPPSSQGYLGEHHHHGPLRVGVIVRCRGRAAWGCARLIM